MPNRSGQNRVWLIDFSPEQAAHAYALEQLRYAVTRGSKWNSAEISELKNSPPSAVIIDLSRTPSKGRDVALAIRSHASMLPVPIVLAAGDEVAVSRFRTLIPDATASDWDSIRTALTNAIANPPRGAVKQSAFAAYAGTALPKKLGIRDGFVIALENAPPDFESMLGDLRDETTVRRDHAGPRDLTLWFVTSLKQLERGMKAMTVHAAHGRLWIMWPKQRPGIDAELTQQVVRKIAMDAGLVDFKISRIDETWSGLRFTTRKR